MNDYEARRLENIKRNESLLKELRIASRQVTQKPRAAPSKTRKLNANAQPTRSSARLSATDSPPSYSEALGAEQAIRKPKRPHKTATDHSQRRQVAAVQPAAPPQDIERLRAAWHSWTVAAAAPTRDENATFHFASHPDFAPNKSPEEMLREGCFGGSYFRPLRSARLGITVADDWRELPAAWTAGLNSRRCLTAPVYDPGVNKFRVACGQSIEEWEAAGWINHAYDVRGWFQWYCRFFVGRRCEDDDRQVGRWRRCVGESGRWRRMLLKRYVALGVREVFDDGEDDDRAEVSPVMHQTCHHWAFEVRQHLLDEYWRTGR